MSMNYAVNTPTLSLTVVLEDGSSIPVGNPRGPRLQIIRNVRQWCPYLYLVVDDVTGVLGAPSSSLRDGSFIGISVGRGSVLETSMWKCYGTPSRAPSPTNPQIFTYTIRALPVGVADTLIQRPTKSWAGDGISVLKGICGQLGLEFYTNTASTYSMSWLPKHSVWKDYMETIMSHTYVDESAVIMDCIDSTYGSGTEYGRYSVVNVPLLFKNTPVMYICHGRSFADYFPSVRGAPILYCATSHHTSRSGEQGFRTLYGMDSHEIKKDGSSLYHSKVTPSDASRTPDVSQDYHMTGNLSPRVIPKPLPCGNTHEKYIRAEHLFVKSRGIYSQHVEVLTDTPTQLKLFDLVIFSQADVNGNLMEEISGYYFVSGKNSFVNAGQYFEKIELTSGGVN